MTRLAKMQRKKLPVTLKFLREHPLLNKEEKLIKSKTKSLRRK